MGEHIRAVSAAMRAVTGCARVYMLLFAESHRQVHVHLVPRHEADDATKAWALADLYRAVAAGGRTAATPADDINSTSVGRSGDSRITGEVQFARLGRC